MKRASFHRLIHAIFAFPILLALVLAYCGAIAPYQAAKSRWNGARKQWATEVESVGRVREVRDRLGEELDVLRREVEREGSIDFSKVSQVSQTMAMVRQWSERAGMTIEELAPASPSDNSRLVAVNARLSGDYAAWCRLSTALESQSDQIVVRELRLDRSQPGVLIAQLKFLAIRENFFLSEARP